MLRQVSELHNQQDRYVKTKIYVAILALLCFMGGALVAGNRLFYSTGHYGPYDCGSACTGGYPSPDAGTRAYIQSMNAALERGGEYIELVGDKFTICNGTYCITYTRTSDGRFLGENVQPQVNYGGGGGGGGGEGGGGGGPVGDPFVGRGGGSGGSGTVIVRPPSKVQQ